MREIRGRDRKENITRIMSERGILTHKYMIVPQMKIKFSLVCVSLLVFLKPYCPSIEKKEDS